MRGTMLIRLVDITLLLLLSLLAAASIRSDDVSAPVSLRMEQKGVLLHPVQVVIHRTGEITIGGAGIDLPTLAEYAARASRVEFFADHQAPLVRLREAHAVVRRVGAESVFLVSSPGEQ